MRWRLRIHHEHGTEEIPNVIEGDTVPIPEGLAVNAVTLAPEEAEAPVIDSTYPGGPPEPTFATEPSAEDVPEPPVAQTEGPDVAEPVPAPLPAEEGTVTTNTEVTP